MTGTDMDSPKLLILTRHSGSPNVRTNGERDARKDYGKLSAMRIAQSIGSFADDPPDNRYQREYLLGLWALLRKKMPK